LAAHQFGAARFHAYRDAGGDHGDRVAAGDGDPAVQSDVVGPQLESAQNIVSAMLQRARSRAIGLQASRGVFFFEDQATKKTAMVMVKIDDFPFPNVIELDEEADEYQTLPLGVGRRLCWGMIRTRGPAPVGRRSRFTGLMGLWCLTDWGGL